MIMDGLQALVGFRRGTKFGRELNTALFTCILGVVTYIGLNQMVPQLLSAEFKSILEKFVGVSWPFFATVAAFLYFVVAAYIVEVFALAIPRDWERISLITHWASEACPLVGLLTTFLSLLLALMAYGEAGPGKPETQAVFISQFAIAFGSSIAGGVLALLSFTLHRLIAALGEDEN